MALVMLFAHFQYQYYGGSDCATMLDIGIYSKFLLKQYWIECFLHGLIHFVFYYVDQKSKIAPLLLKKSQHNRNKIFFKFQPRNYRPDWTETVHKSILIHLNNVFTSLFQYLKVQPEEIYHGLCYTTKMEKSKKTKGSYSMNGR